MMRSLVLALAFVPALFVAPALAQHNHAQHHASYQNWINQNDRGYCNDQDCGQLDGSDERVTSAGTVEVKIEGEWCPVLPHHYLKRGSTPDWSTSHVCVQRNFAGNVPVCVRLLCYQPKPGS